MSEKKKADPLAIVAKLAAAERKLSTDTFLAPVVAGGRVRVRVQGIAYELKVEDSFEGWALLRMSAPGKARVIEKASPALVGRYLKLFPRVRLILLRQFDDRWWAMAASTSDTRFRLTEPVPLYLVSGANTFDTINARFDGAAFWFDGIDRRRDSAVKRTLTSALANKVKPDELECLGVVPQERLAYRMMWLESYGDEKPREPDTMTRIRSALHHAGAELAGVTEQGDNRASIRFTVDGAEHNVSIRPSDLGVLSAGICLSGQDEDFDLSSLVGVLREYASEDYY